MKNLILTSLVTLSIAFLSFKAGKELTYKVDAKKSTTLWTGKKVTGEHKGAVPVSSGAVIVTDKKVTGGTFELNLANLTVTDITEKESNAKLVGHLKSEDFFSTTKYPTSKFVITKVASKGEDNYEVTGNLTIKGVTNPVTFPAVIKTTDKILTATGQITVDRTKYDIKYKSANFFENLGDKAISDDFILDVNLIANAQ